MDEEVRRVTEGQGALEAELNRLPATARLRLQRFVDGINAYIDQVQGNPATMPAEFTLLNDLPIQHFSVADIVGFGEYAGRFFGEFGHGELGAAATYEHLVARFGRKKAEKVFHDLLPLNDPHAPTSIAARDGRFPRHTRGHVKTKYQPRWRRFRRSPPPRRLLTHAKRISRRCSAGLRSRASGAMRCSPRAGSRRTTSR